MWLKKKTKEPLHGWSKCKFVQMQNERTLIRFCKNCPLVPWGQPWRLQWDRLALGFLFAPGQICISFAVATTDTGMKLWNREWGYKENLCFSPLCWRRSPLKSLTETKLISPTPPSLKARVLASDHGQPITEPPRFQRGELWCWATLMERSRAGGEAILLAVRSSSSRKTWTFWGGRWQQSQPWPPVLSGTMVGGSDITWLVLWPEFGCGPGFPPHVPILAQLLGLVRSVPEDTRSCPIPFQ